ncbi:MAG TPA: hypothetical protein VM012_06230 [Flavitalea sp.]|nr:hypothetical protein [Flavitalea sp.]
MLKKLILTVMAACVLLTSYSQTNPPARPAQKQDKKAAKRERINTQIRQEEEGELIFNKQSVFGVKLATDGYGLTYELGRFKTNRKSLLYQFEFSEKKHKKEKKQAASFNQFQVNSVVYGKENNFYQFKAGIAMQQLIGGKGNKNGVAVSAIYGAGISAGLVKPYYVDVEDNLNQRVRKTYPEIIDSGYIEFGAAGFTVGWDELKVRPGVYGKAALRFDYGRFNETVTAIEAGLMAEFYSSKIPQVVLNKQRQFFFSAYLSLQLGRRK